MLTGKVVVIPKHRGCAETHTSQNARCVGHPAFLADSIQHIHSLRASGVMSSHAANACGLDASAFFKSAGYKRECQEKVFPQDGGVSLFSTFPFIEPPKPRLVHHKREGCCMCEGSACSGDGDIVAALGRPGISGATSAASATAPAATTEAK